MKNLKYIRKITEAYPYNYENPPICKVELWDFSRANENDEARKEAVCLVASIDYDNEYCKDPDRFWNLLIEKGYENPFEFVREYSALNQTYNLRNEQLDTMTSIQEVTSTDYIRDMIDINRHNIATFKLKVPIFVARQIQRHRSFSYMEMSRRFVKGDKVKFEYWLRPEICRYKEIIEDIYDEYEGDYKPEQLCSILPLGLYTQFWMQGDYKAWLNLFIHCLQLEIQEEVCLVIQSMWGLLKEYQPEIIETMADYIDEWTRDCNPMFRTARKKKADWFRENFLGGE